MLHDEIIYRTRRNLPHVQTMNSYLFVTWKLAFKLPQPLQDKLSDFNLKVLNKSIERNSSSTEDSDYLKDKLYFEYYDTLLGQDKSVPQTLNQPALAKVVVTALHFYDIKQYSLICYCVMPNHVHLIINPLEKTKGTPYLLSDIMRNIKGYTSKEINKILLSTGMVWQQESYDRVMRTEKELQNTIEYTLYNPVKAGLCNKIGDFPYSFVNPEYYYI